MYMEVILLYRSDCSRLGRICGYCSLCLTADRHQSGYGSAGVLTRTGRDRFREESEMAVLQGMVFWSRFAGSSLVQSARKALDAVKV